jgi:hypothetical protein
MRPTGMETGEALRLFAAAKKIIAQPRGAATGLLLTAHNSVREIEEAALLEAARASRAGSGNRPGQTNTAMTTTRQTSQAAMTSRVPSDAGWA